MNDIVRIAAEINTLCNVRDSLREMLSDSYEGRNYILKPLPDGNQHSTKIRKTTLKEARERIKVALDKLNRVINIIAQECE